ncbi:MAG: gamma-glutamyltransferase [Acidimicrobiia bacterium]|nr:gamma-glutamyltransferase [Acidimicrobiia bacterium]
MKVATGRGGMAAAPHHLAAEAALHVMAQGGNSVDGAIAANAVLGVVLPETCGPGGDLFALVHRPGDSVPACLNSSGRAGSGASAQELRDQGHDAIPFQGPWSVTVPGCVDGWEALSERFGSVPLGQTLRRAIELCAGFPASSELAAALGRAQGWLEDTPSANELYPGGAPPAPGDILSRPLLETTLHAIANGGRGSFFELVGPAITAATGGRITREDYSRVQSDWIDPIGTEVFGRTAWTVPPNSQGYLTLAAAAIFERLEVPADHTDPRFQHGLIEAYRAVSWERNDVVTDAIRAPSVDLLDRQRLDDRAAAVDLGTIARWPDSPDARSGTAYLCVIDANGMGVSLIQSNYTGIGSGLSAGNTGVFLHSRGAGFNLRDGHPNELAPGNRPLHTLAPTMWTRSEQLDTLLGTRGGHVQPQLLLQVAANRMVAGLSATDAQAAPRWTLDELAGTPPVRVEPGFPEGLAEYGHSVEVTPGPMEGWGPVSLIEVDTDGTRTGAADPRVSTAAAVAD